MSKSKQNSSSDKSPFRSPSQNLYVHKLYFLHFINEITPEVGTAIKELTPQCEKLFGKFPESNADQQEIRNIRTKISTVFDRCLWKDSREGYGAAYWLNFLVNDEKLKQLAEIEKRIDNEAEEFIASLTEKELDNLRERFASNYTKPKEFIDIIDLKSSYRNYLDNRLYETDKNYLRLIKLKYSKKEPLIEFQKSFDALLADFYLEKQWLARSVFEAIWDGTGILKIEFFFIEAVPQEILREIENRLETETVFFNDRYEKKKFSPSFENNIPLPKPFVYRGLYWIENAFEKYEDQAVKAYREHIHNYFKIIEESFKKFGYKQKTGKKYSYERVKWLVWWNVEGWNKNKILEEIEKESRNEKEIGNELDISTIDKAFRKFKSYDLPVMKKGRN